MTFDVRTDREQYSPIFTKILEVVYEYATTTIIDLLVHERVVPVSNFLGTRPDKPQLVFYSWLAPILGGGLARLVAHCLYYQHPSRRLHRVLFSMSV